MFVYIFPDIRVDYPRYPQIANSSWFNKWSLKELIRVTIKRTSFIKMQIPHNTAQNWIFFGRTCSQKCCRHLIFICRRAIHLKHISLWSWGSLCVLRCACWQSRLRLERRQLYWTLFSIMPDFSGRYAHCVGVGLGYMFTAQNRGRKNLLPGSGRPHQKYGIGCQYSAGTLRQHTIVGQ